MKINFSLYILITLFMSLVPLLTYGDNTIYYRGYHIIFKGKIYYFDEHPPIRKDQQLCEIERSLFFEANQSAVGLREAYHDVNSPYKDILRYPNFTYPNIITWACHYMAEDCCGNTCCPKKGILGDITGEVMYALYKATRVYLMTHLLFTLCTLLGLLILTCFCCWTSICAVYCIYRSRKEKEEATLSVETEENSNSS